MGSIQILRGLVFSPSCSEGASSPRSKPRSKDELRLSASLRLQKADMLLLPCKESGLTTPSSTTPLQKGFIRKATMLWRSKSTKIERAAELPGQACTGTALETAGSPPASASSRGEATPGEGSGTSPRLAPWTQEAWRRRKRSRILSASLNQIA